METEVPQREIVIRQDGKNPVNQIITYAVGAALIGGTVYFGKKWYAEHQANTEAENLNTPEAEVASKIYASESFFGNNTDMLYDAARTISANKLEWKKVADAFQKEHGQNIEDFLQKFKPDQLKIFYDIFQLTTSSVTKPPPTAKLQFDTTKDFIIVKATKNVNIRKSPKVMGTEVLIKYINPISKSNVIALAKPDKVLGYLTGKTFASPNGDNTSTVLFYEVGFFTIDDTTKSTFQNFWVAGSQIDIAKQVPVKDRTKGFDFFMQAIKNKTGAFLTQSQIDNASE